MQADDLIRELRLKPHPEGGHFAETFRSELEVESSAHAARRSASTSIYFLLRSGEFSALHSVRSDEVWHHYLGDPVELIYFDGAEPHSVVLGADFAAKQRPQFVVRRDRLQAARALTGAHGFALCGCTVAPGFDFADFELPPRSELLTRYPNQQSLIYALTRH